MRRGDRSGYLCPARQVAARVGAALDLRMHRNLLIIDDRIAFTGSMNHGDPLVIQAKIQNPSLDRCNCCVLDV